MCDFGGGVFFTPSRSTAGINMPQGIGLKQKGFTLAFPPIEINLSTSLLLLGEETDFLFVLHKQTNWSRIPTLKCQEKQTDRKDCEWGLLYQDLYVEVRQKISETQTNKKTKFD